MNYSKFTPLILNIKIFLTERIVCLRHADKLCSCPPSKYCLRYRYTLDEIPAMLSRLKERAECYEIWHKNVEKALEATDDNKVGKFGRKTSVLPLRCR